MDTTLEMQNALDEVVAAIVQGFSASTRRQQIVNQLFTVQRDLEKLEEEQA